MRTILLFGWILILCMPLLCYFGQDIVVGAIIILFVLRRSRRLVHATLHQEPTPAGSHWISVTSTIIKYIVGAIFLMLLLKYFGSQPVDLNQGYLHEWAKFIPTF